MIEQNLEKILHDINHNLIKEDDLNLFKLIQEDYFIKNKDFHRYEIIQKNVQGIQFFESSFRGAFVDNSEFLNCKFERCSFVVANIVNSRFINCEFRNCIFLSHFIDGNFEDNCEFFNCYNENVLVNYSSRMLSLNNKL